MCEGSSRLVNCQIVRLSSLQSDLTNLDNSHGSSLYLVSVIMHVQMVEHHNSTQQQGSWVTCVLVQRVLS